MSIAPGSSDSTNARVPQAVIDVVKEMSDWVDKLTEDDLMEPPTASVAGQDLSAVQDDEVRHRRIVVGLALTANRFLSGCSCLDALVACEALSDPVTPTHTLARVVFETAAWGRWLAARGLTTEQRISRIAADELHGILQKQEMVKEVKVRRAEEDAFRLTVQSAGISLAPRPRSTS